MAKLWKRRNYVYIFNNCHFLVVYIIWFYCYHCFNLLWSGHGRDCQELEFKTIFVLCLLVLTYTRTNFGEQFTVKHFVYLSFWFSCVFNWSSSLLSLALMSSTPKHGKKIVKWWLFKIKLVELERTLIVWRYKAKVSQGLNNFLWQCRYIPEVAFL